MRTSAPIRDRAAGLVSQKRVRLRNAGLRTHLSYSDGYELMCASVSNSRRRSWVASALDDLAPMCHADPLSALRYCINIAASGCKESKTSGAAKFRVWARHFGSSAGYGAAPAVPHRGTPDGDSYRLRACAVLCIDLFSRSRMVFWTSSRSASPRRALLTRD